MAKKRLLVDMDGTLARFHEEDMYLERMFEKGFFWDLKPFENMVEAIRELVLNHSDEVEVFIVSAKVASEFCVAEKNAWLNQYLPEIDSEHRIFTEIGHSKAEYIPGGVSKDDYLLDDYNNGLNLFLADGGHAIKVMNNINMRGLGAFGGDRGLIWMGPLVCTDVPPAITVGDLLEQMGLNRDRKREAEALGFKVLSPDEDLQNVPDFGDKPYLLGTQPDSSGAYFGGAGWGRGAETFASFGDALKCLDAVSGDYSSAYSHRIEDAFKSYTLRSMDGKDTLTLPAWQASALSKNLSLDLDPISLAVGGPFPGLMIANMRTVLSEASLPVYGMITYLGPDGSAQGGQIFHSPESMRAELLECEHYCIPIRSDWFIPSNLPAVKAKANSLDSKISAASRSKNQSQAPAEDHLKDIPFQGRN